MPRQPIHRFWRSPVLPFVESRMARDSRACYAPHSHANLSVGAVDGGRSVFRHGHQCRPLSRGDVVLIPAGEVHACNPEDDGQWSYQMLYLTPHWVHAVVGEMDSFDAQVLRHLPSHTTPRQLHTRLRDLNRRLFGSAPVQDRQPCCRCGIWALPGHANVKRFGIQSL